MQWPPRPRSQNVITRSMLARAWGFLGLISAVLVMAAFLIVLLRAGWDPGDAVGAGSRLHRAYRQATTVTWVGIVACQLGTAMAVRTEYASLRSVGLFTNRPLLGALAGVYVSVAHTVLGTEALSVGQWALVAPFPFIVWGADELRRWYPRRPEATGVGSQAPAPSSSAMKPPLPDHASRATNWWAYGRLRE